MRTSRATRLPKVSEKAEQQAIVEFRRYMKAEMRAWAQEANARQGTGTTDARFQCREIRKHLKAALAEFDRLFR